MDNSQLWAKPDQTLVVTFDELSSYTGGKGEEQQYCFGNRNELMRHGQLGAIWLVSLYFLRYTIY